MVVFREHAQDWAPGERLWLETDVVGKALTSVGQLVTGTERAWRMAHLEGVLNGLVAFLVACILPLLDNLSAPELRTLSSLVALTGYGNSVASVIAATFSVRGFVPAGSAANQATTGLFATAVGTVLYSAALIVKGVWK